MGTNYYWQCAVPYERRHIGKSSGGWCFSLHVFPEEGIHDLEDWEKIWMMDGQIVDEYGATHTPAEMLTIICDRSRKPIWHEKPPIPYGYGTWEDFHRVNYSERGPKGLLRHQLTEQHCIKQGAGTWDCIVGDFS